MDKTFTTDSQVIEKLDRCILRGHPILFTGAGFSKGGHLASGRDIPVGSAVKELLLTELLGFDKDSEDFEDLNNNTLSDICNYAYDELSEAKVHDYIMSLFSNCIPENYHVTIANHEWKKIYTTNIDDLFENAAKNTALTVQNMERQRSYTLAKSREYIKLHGCVRNPSGPFTFSRQEYIDSMLKSTDYRFSSFANDIQTESFIFLGTEMNEMNLDYYLKLFQNVYGRSTNGQLYFINPYPSRIFLSKTKKVGAQVIAWTTKQFAEHLKELSKVDTHKANVYDLDGYVHLNSQYSKDKSFKGYDSKLYFGYNPVLKDIIFDWDFQNPEINDLYNKIISTLESDREKNLVVSLIGKSMSGKSVYLKRLAHCLINSDFVVYELIDRRFDPYYFLSKCRMLPDSDIALIMDNGSFYYNAIKNLLKKFPSSKKIVVITSSRPYYHNRKRYNLVSEDNVIEHYVSCETVSKDNIFAKNIINKLDNKGLLGEMKSLSSDDRIKYVCKINDVSTLLYNITYGTAFRKRQRNRFREMKSLLGDKVKFLQILAVFQKLDLPYFPLELLGLWDFRDYNSTLEECEDFIKYSVETNGIELRNDILTDDLIRMMDGRTKLHLIRDILVLVSPQVSETIHSYWNEIQSTLMKGKLLRKKLGMTNGEVKNLLFDVKNFYDDDYNYWIQVGIAEQNDNDFEKSLNHFRQAESLNPKSYLVLNAIARNFLRQANITKSYSEAKILFEEGERKMLKLIRDREEFQVKAFSTHCYLYEKMRFLKIFKIRPSKDELQQMFNMLKSILDKDDKDPMARHISNLFSEYVKKAGFSGIFNLNMYDLTYLRTIMGESQKKRITEILEDFEIE